MGYRVIDISGGGELMRHWNRPAWDAMPPKLIDHTALTDIREGVKELRYYREHGSTTPGNSSWQPEAPAAAPAEVGEAATR